VKYIGYEVHAEVATRETVDTARYPVVKGKRTAVRTPRIRQAVNIAAAVQPKVGSPPRTSEATLHPSGEVRYQWYGGDQKIKGATSRVYTPTSADVGKKLKVKAFIPGDSGYLRAGSVSKATAAVEYVNGLG
jgi:hypothetical protein